MPDTDARPLRFCDQCGQLDDHPRHVIDGVTIGKPPDEVLATFSLDGAPPAAVAQLFATNVRCAHLDCCAAAGCPQCQATEKATKGKRGDALTALVTAGATAELELPELPVSMQHATGEEA